VWLTSAMPASMSTAMTSRGRLGRFTGRVFGHAARMSCSSLLVAGHDVHVYEFRDASLRTR
jgi:hypothetical protein